VHTNGPLYGFILPGTHGYFMIAPGFDEFYGEENKKYRKNR
jgi:hypothetical protein